jgi:hypothetical protein
MTQFDRRAPITFAFGGVATAASAIVFSAGETLAVSRPIETGWARLGK